MEQEKKIQSSEKRQLKVYEKLFLRAYNQHVAFPEIRLCGKWLKELGFETGKDIEIKQQKHKLTITLNNKK